MTLLAARLKRLREDFRFPQRMVAEMLSISAPGWIKIENGQRMPSEKLVQTLCTTFATNPKQSKALRDELLLCKYLESNSAFVRQMATETARLTPLGQQLLVELAAPRPKAKRGRPRRKSTGAAR